MSDEKQSDDTSQAEIVNSEKDEQKDNSDRGKTDKVKSTYFLNIPWYYTFCYTILYTRWIIVTN